MAVAAVAVLLIILLVQGCMSEHAKASGNALSPLKPAQNARGQVAETQTTPSKPVLPLPALPVASVATTPSVAQTTATKSVVPKPELVYVVKRGDTLSQIARHHQTTVKAIKLANDLKNDTIFVGHTLKLPQS